MLHTIFDVVRVLSQGSTSVADSKEEMTVVVFEYNCICVRARTHTRTDKDTYVYLLFDESLIIKCFSILVLHPYTK